MRKTIMTLIWTASLFTLFDSAAQPPATKKTPTMDTYYGRQVTDNYRWLEDMNNKEVQDWFKSQHD